MSHIPNSAMPHAKPSGGEHEQGSKAAGKKRGSALADKARENPKTAIAAGAALVAGAIAAAAIPIVKARKKNEPKAPKVASPHKPKKTS